MAGGQLKTYVGITINRNQGKLTLEVVKARNFLEAEEKLTEKGTSLIFDRSELLELRKYINETLKTEMALRKC